MNNKLLLFLSILTVYCKGQNSKITNLVYSQKLEYGLRGDVKEVTQYTCNVKDGKMPSDISNYIGKSIMTFDKSGNVLTINRLWYFGKSDRASEYKMAFAGRGKDITYKLISNIRGEITKASYSYQWSDEYHYSIICQDNGTNLSTVTLDENYRLINDFYKGDGIEYSEDTESIYKSDRIKEINKITTMNNHGKSTVSYDLQIVQEFDKYGNPTVIYGYNDPTRLEIKFVVFKEYKYY